MKWSRYIVAAIVCLNLSTTADAHLTLGQTRGTPRIISISPGPTAEAAGERLLATVEAITNATATHPYVIMLDPGRYDLGEESLVMKPWISIRGSDREMTRIFVNNVLYLVKTASNTDIGGLTLENQGGPAGTITIFSHEVENVIIHDVAVMAINSNGDVVGIYNEQASPTLRHVTVYCSGTGAVDGINNIDGASPSIWHADVHVKVPADGTGSGIKNNYGCSPDIYDVSINVETAGGTARAWGLYFLGECFPRVNRARVTVSGGDFVAGIFSGTNSFLVLRDIRVIVNGVDTAGEAYGIFSDGNASFDLELGRITVYDGDTMTGVEGRSNHPFGISIRRSNILSDGAIIQAFRDVTVRVASSVIKGTVTNWIYAPVNCINCVDPDYAPLDDGCQPIP